MGSITVLKLFDLTEMIVVVKESSRSMATRPPSDRPRLERKLSSSRQSVTAHSHTSALAG